MLSLGMLEYLLYDLKKNLFVPIDHAFCFNSSNLDKEPYLLSDNASIYYHLAATAEKYGELSVSKCFAFANKEVYGIFEKKTVG